MIKPDVIEKEQVPSDKINLINRTNVLEKAKEHMHQRLLDIGIPPPPAVLSSIVQNDMIFRTRFGTQILFRCS